MNTIQCSSRFILGLYTYTLMAYKGIEAYRFTYHNTVAICSIHAESSDRVFSLRRNRNCDSNIHVNNAGIDSFINISLTSDKIDSPNYFDKFFCFISLFFIGNNQFPTWAISSYTQKLYRFI